MDTKSLEGCCLSKTVLCHMESSPTTKTVIPQPKERISRSHDRSLSAHLPAVPLWDLPTKEQRETMTGLGNPKQTMLLLIYAARPISEVINLSKTHFYKPRRTQKHKGRQEPKSRTQREGCPVQAPLGAVPGDS